MDINAVTEAIIGAAIEVHRALGPGLLESAYQACLVHELGKRDLRVEAERPLRIVYDGVALDCGYRLDLVVDDCVIVEIKAVKDVLPIHKAQLLSYLKLSGMRVGLLINFHVQVLTDGVRRVVDKFEDQSLLVPLPFSAFSAPSAVRSSSCREKHTE